MVHKKACLLATGNNNSSHANCMNQVEGILTRFKYSLVYFEDGTRQYFCQWGGGGVEGGMVTVQLTLPPLVLNLMTESSFDPFLIRLPLLDQYIEQ